MLSLALAPREPIARSGWLLTTSTTMPLIAAITSVPRGTPKSIANCCAPVCVPELRPSSFECDIAFVLRVKGAGIEKIERIVYQFHLEGAIILPLFFASSTSFSSMNIEL